MRLRAIEKALKGLPSFNRLSFGIGWRSLSRALLCRVHSPVYLDELTSLARQASTPVLLDPDTVLMRGTLPAAFAAAQSGVAAVDAVLAGRIDNAFCLTRPPGHHARRHLAMGFCFINNVAVAAAHALDSVERVAIVDFDVHHGNGTEEWVRRAGPRASYFSLHEDNLWPVTGLQSDSHIVNVRLASGTGGKALRKAFAENIVPGLRQARPDLILISAGFDAHKNEYVGSNLAYRTADYGFMTDQIRRVAEECCNGRIVSLLEGGYNPASLAQGAAAHVQALQGVWREDSPQASGRAVKPPTKAALRHYTSARLAAGMPSELYIEMLERRHHVPTGSVKVPPWIDALWEQNPACLGRWLQESLHRAGQGQALLSRQALHFVFDIARTIKASPFAEVADYIPGLSAFCDPDDPKAPAFYEQAALDRKDPRYKALARYLRDADVR